MRITDRIIEIPNYLKDGGSYNDVVIFTRMSMRRNVSDYYFPNKMTDDEREEFRKNITEYLENKKLFPVHYKLKDLSFEERGILVERFILNERLEAKPQDAFLMLNNEIDSGLILNYEDHLIFFNLFPGLEVNQNFENLVSSFYIISKEFKICIDEQFGYLTSSPFYTGTGIILEAFLHLPGISITNRFKEIVFDATEKGFIIYPYFEEKGSASGSIFVIRNKFTLKYSEEEIMEYFKKFVENIIMIEYRERKYIMENAKKEIEDRIWRAYGVLMFAKLLMFDEFLNLFSAFKLGLNYGIIKDANIDFINKMIIFTQKRHLKYIDMRNNLTEDEKRALIVQANIGGKNV